MNENRLLAMDDDHDVGALFGQAGEDLGFEARVMHCDKAQGHRFGAAVRARELEALVERWNSRYAAPKTQAKAGA